MTSQGPGSPKNPGSHKKDAGSKVSDEYLKSLKPRAGEETTRWLADLTQAEMEEIAEASAPPVPPAQDSASLKPLSPADPVARDGMVRFVDRLFDLFTQYQYELNRSLGGADQLGLERPNLIKETPGRRFGADAGPFFIGRLTMRTWSLVINGRTDRVEGYIIPCEDYLKLSTDPGSRLFTSFLRLEPMLGNDQIVYMLDDQLIESSDVPALAKQFVSCLVNVAKGKRTNTEKFVWAPRGQAQQTQTAIGPVPYPASPAKAGEGAGEKTPAYDWRKEAASRSPELEAQAESAPASQAPEFSVPPAEPIEAAAAIKSPPAAQPQAKVSAAPRAAHRSSASEESAMILEQGTMTLSGALDMIKKAIDSEVASLSQAGAKAFESQDLAGAEKILKRISKVKAFSERVDTLLAEWRAALADD